MKKITFLFFGLLASVTFSYGQAGSYSFAESTEVYTPVVGTNSTATGDDGIQDLVSIGFTFNFDGIAYTQFGISTNGWIKMGNVAIGGTSWTNTLSNTAAHRPLIAAFWDDNNRNSGNIQYSLSGTSPNQILEVGWDNVNIGGGGSTSAVNFASYKLRLYETTNVIEFIYGPTMASAGTLTASVGINGASSFLSVTPAATATASSATANNGIASTTNLVGKKYIFTPPLPCTGTPVAGTVAPASLSICSGSLPGNLVLSGYTTGATGITFQWEESLDNFATPGVNAVGGTGATTATYTPPAFSGTPISYRVKVTCTDSALFEYSSSTTIQNPSTPTTQVTNATAANLAYTSATINWTNGNGNRRVVLLSDSPTITDPVDGNAAALVANAVYAGSGEQIIYDGTGATVNVTGLSSDTQYYVKVYEYLRCGTDPYDYFYNTTSGSNEVTFSTLINNDLCVDAITVTCGSSTVGTTNGSTNENAAVCGISGVTTQNTPGVWYKYVGDGSDVTVTTCSSNITTGDSRIAVFSGACGALTCIGGNDDAQLAGCATNTLASVVTFSTVTGTDYYILVYAYLSTSLAFELNVSCVAACTPATTNDECSAATQVTIGTPITAADNTCSSASLGAAYPSCGNMFGTYYDTWYWFDSGSVTDVTIALTNQTGTTGFALYSGTCGALTQVTGSCTLTGASTSLTGLTIGTYYLRVFSDSPATRGSYDLSITDDGLGNNSFDNNSFTYYPNPIKNTLNLSYNQEISNVEVYNLLGQKVRSNVINANDAHIDMSNLSKGAYMVKVTSNDQVKTIKVIKE